MKSFFVWFKVKRKTFHLVYLFVWQNCSRGFDIRISNIPKKSQTSGSLSHKTTLNVSSSNLWLMHVWIQCDYTKVSLCRWVQFRYMMSTEVLQHCWFPDLVPWFQTRAVCTTSSGPWITFFSFEIVSWCFISQLTKYISRWNNPSYMNLCWIIIRFTVIEIFMIISGNQT